MKDEIIIIDANLNEATRSCGSYDDDMPIEIMDNYGITQSVVDIFAHETVLPCALQVPHTGNYSYRCEVWSRLVTTVRHK